MRVQGPLVCLLLLLLSAVPASALDVDRKVVKLRTVELPSIPIAGLDYGSLRAEVAYGEAVPGERVLRTTKSICTPEHSKNKIKDAVEIPTHYYEIPFQTGEGVFVLRDGEGRVVYSSRIEALESAARFGHDRCKYWLQPPLDEDYQAAFSNIVRDIDASARDYFERSVTRELDGVLFFAVIEENVPVYRFEDKLRDYADLNEAATLAEAGYAALERAVAGLGAEGNPDLERAVSIWERALDESDLNDKRARINRKVTVKLHESLAVALIALGEPARGVSHMEKAQRYSSMSTSRSGGTGTSDLMVRARMRKGRAHSNAELPEDPAELEAVMQRVNHFRGKVPVVTLPERERLRLETEYVAFVGETILDTVEAEQAEREEAVASGKENPYERMVGNTAMQGFYLFLMPYPEKLEAFPSEVCELTYLNRLRMPNHRFDSVPEEIGNMAHLEVLDLSGNRIQSLPHSIGGLTSLKKLDLSGNKIQTLPDEIGRLENLKQLQLKGNPLAPGETERLEKLLPGCKIKS